MIEYTLTPEELAALNRKYAGPQIQKWQRSMTREEYLQAMFDGKSSADIMLSYFNNDPQELKKQLREWGLSQEQERRELEELGRITKPIEMTREQYLQRRASGEGRMRISRSLGVDNKRFYALLTEWGLREKDAEEWAIELLITQSDEQSSEEIMPETQQGNTETLAEIGAEQETANLQTDLQKSEQEATSILERDRRISELNGQINDLEARYQFDKERTLKLEGDVERLVRRLEEEERETKHLNELLKGAAIVADQAGARINELEEEQCALLAIIDAASENAADPVVIIRVPITAAMQPIQQRIGVYNGIDLFESAVEAAELDRTRVMSELFALVQRVADYVTSDLVELIPGEDVSKYVQRFMAYHNDQHIERMKIKQQAG
ncbi:hypothetical protein [Paenibacillus periandrae]|uniref:hypothetical protein n=1 Tax=Paenibacillus periandrae TaxID=1761741 RepID=UPI001F08E8CF|nr:hypothetical protein [Paenibacillus periandrae]